MIKFNIDPTIANAIDTIGSMINQPIVINPSLSTKHRFKMKTKRLKKKLFKYPHRYYNKEFADFLEYNLRGTEFQMKLSKMLRDSFIYR